MKVALVAIVKQESNLQEWITWHKSWGFDSIFLYLNDWNPLLCEVVNATILEINGKAKQLEAYNNWIQVYGPSYDYVAFFDADEYLFLTNKESIKDLLGDSSLGINWIFFGSKEDQPGKGVVTRFKYHQKFVDRHIKTIVKLDKGVMMKDPHHPNQLVRSPEGEVIKGPFNPVGVPHNAFIAHYYTQDFKYFQKKCDRGRADTGDKFNHSYSEWDEYNKHCNDIYDGRLAERFKQLK